MARSRQTTIKASPTMVEVLADRRRADEAVRAEQQAERERAAKAAEARQPTAPKLAEPVTAEKPKKLAKPLPEQLPTGKRKPLIVWAGDVPIIFPHDPSAYGPRRRELIDAAIRAVSRRTEDKPGQARYLALKLEETLGVTPADGFAAWATIRDMLEDLGSARVAADIGELAGVKPKRQRSAKPKKAAKKKQAVKYSEGVTPERARKSRLVEEPIYAVDPTAQQPERRGGQDALPPPKMILVGRAMRDRSLDPKTRLERFKKLETQHVAAGVRFAADWERAALEPHLTVNMLATGGGSSADAWAEGLSQSVMRARDSLHAAIKVLTLGGHDVVHVVEAVVLNGESSTLAASSTYADKPRASAHVAATLKFGLNLLERHYNSRRKPAVVEHDPKERA